MKLQALGITFSTALRASAQLVSFVLPTPNSHITAGQSFTATVAIASTTSSVDIIALVFGARHTTAQDVVVDLGQTRLATVTMPQFSSGPDGRMVHEVRLTLPINMINGLDQPYNLTVGEFFMLGAENTPQTHTAQVSVFAAST